MIFIFAHADPPTVRERYTGLLPAGSVLRPFVLPGGSSAAYEQHARALRAKRRTVAAGLRAAYAADRPADEPMVLVTFSAGYGLARELLRDTDPGIAALVWRFVLTTGTGSIFGFLVARQAYQSALLAP